MSSASKSILIIGGGVIGLSTAYYCARRGHRVTLIDRNPEQRDGCSFGNAGMVVPSHFVPLAAHMNFQPHDISSQFRRGLM